MVIVGDACMCAILGLQMTKALWLKAGMLQIRGGGSVAECVDVQPMVGLQGDAQPRNGL